MFLRYLAVFFIIISSIESYAQKNYKLRVVQVSTNIGDCDGWPLGDSDPLWRMYGDGDCTSYETTCNGCTRSISEVIYDRNFICRTDIPGSIPTRLRGCENDGAASCTVPICDGNNVDNSWTEALPAPNNGTYANTTRTATSGGGGCQSGRYFSMVYRWEVSGTWRTDINQNSDGYLTNTTCGTAYSISPSLPSNDSWRGPVRGHIKRCNNYTYYKFTLTQDVTYLEIDMFNSDGEVDLFYGSSCGCALSNDAGLFDKDFKVNDAKAGVYVIRLKGGGDYVDVDIRTGSGIARPSYDNICQARNLGLMYNSNVGGAQWSGSGTNVNSSSEDFCGVSEPNDDDARTIWHYFYTGANVGHSLRVLVDGNGGDNMTPDIALYRYGSVGSGLTANPFSCSSTPNFSNLTLLADDDGTTDPVTCSLSDQTAEVWITDCNSKLTPNTLYFLQVDGDDGSLYCTLAEGTFSIRIDHKEAPNTACSAHDLSSLFSGGSLTRGDAALSYQWFTNNTSCDSDQANEPSTDGDDKTVWFKFTTGSDVGDQMIIDGNSLEGYGTCIGAAGVEVYEVSNCGDFTTYLPVIDQDAGILGDPSRTVVDCPKPNSTYWVQVQGDDFIGLGTCESNDFELIVSMSNTTNFSRPSNDDYCNATLLGGSYIAAFETASLNNQNNGCASLQLNEPSLGGAGSNDQTVWFTFRTDANPPTEIEVNASGGIGNGNCSYFFGTIPGSFYPNVKVFKAPATSCPASITSLTLVPDEANLDQTVHLIDCPEPNTWYYVQVFTGFGSTCSSGDFDISVTGGPTYYNANDDLCNAFDLGTLNNQATINAATLNGGVNFTTFCSSKQAGEPNVDFGDGWGDEEGSVWFKFKPAGTLGGPKVIGAKVAIEAIEIGEVALTEQLYVRLYEDPSGCGTLNDLIELNNVEDEEYYTPEAVLIDDCATSQIGDAVPRTRFYGCLEPGKTYYVQVIVRESVAGVSTDLGLTDERGHFNLVITNSRTVPNNNDDFSDAMAMPAIPGATMPQNATYPAPGVLQNVNNLCMTVEPWEVTTPEIPDLDHTAWYRFVAPASGSVQFQVVNAGTSDPEESIEPQITVFKYNGTGTPTSTDILMEYNADDDFFFGEDGQITWDDYVMVHCLNPGQTYYLRVDGAMDATGYCAEIEALDGDEMRGVYDIYARDYDIWESNDLICSAGEGSPSDITSSANQSAGDLAIWNDCGQNITLNLDYQSNYCANNLNEAQINPWDNSPNNTVWYSFIAPGTGMVTIDAYNTFSCTDPTRAGRAPFIDLRLAVYDILDGFDCFDINSGTPAVQLMGAAESDGILEFNCIGLGETLEIDCLIPGRRYWLVVDGKPRTGNPDGNTGEFRLELSNVIEEIFNLGERDPQPPAPNDLLCNAVDLGDPTGGGVDTDFNNPTYPSPARGCANSENTYCAGTGGGEPAINGFTLWGTDHTVWYTFTAPSTGAVNIFVDGDVHGNSDQLAPQIAVFETSDQVNPCAGTLYDIFAGPQISNGFSETYNSGTINCLEPGYTYFLMVDGGPLALEGFGTHGTFEVTITEVPATEFGPANDDICDATTINPFTSVGHGGAPVTLNPETNRCASREFQIPEPSTFTRDRTVWYEFTTPANPSGSNGNGTYAIDIQVTSDWPWPFGDAVDPQIAVYESSDNTCSGTITEFYSDYDLLNIPFIETLNVQCLLPATTYYIMVDGSLLNVQGYFELEVTEDLNPTPIAVNDDICSAVDLGVIPVTVGQSIGLPTLYNNFCSGIEPGEPDPNWLLVNNIDNTVWFKFKTPNNGQNINVDFDLNSNSSDEVDLQIALYQSSDETCTGDLYEIASEYDPTLLFCADGLCDEDLNDICLSPNTTYFLQVDGSFLNRMGYFTVEIINDGFPGGPANDNFCNAKPMPAFSAGVSRLNNENNECATLELNEPLVGHPLIIGNGRRTVWYSFVAPASGRVEIVTEDADGILGFGGIDPSWALYEYSGGCPQDFSSFVQLENSYWPTIGVANPDDEDDYRCLWPGQTYYIQIDGTVLGDDGVFNIEVRDIYPNYTTTGPEPVNNFCIDATPLTVQDQSCQFEGGTWQSFTFGEATRSLPNVTGCGDNCGDTWFTFNMPPLDPSCPGNLSFVKVEGRDYTTYFPTSECLGETFSRSDLSVIAYRGGCGGLQQIECSVSSSETVVGDVDFTIAGTPGEQIWLQVFSNNGNCFDNDDFDLCVSQRFSADDCTDALLDPMEYNVEYCWDIRDATGEDPGAGDSGYYLGGVAPNVTDNSVYFQFDTDDFCWGYKVIIRIDDTRGLSENGNCNNPGLPFESPSGVMQYTLFQDPTPCDNVYDARVDFEEIDDCMPGFANEVYWEHTYYVTNSPNLQGDSLHANSTYIIQLESDNRDIMDGTIEVHKLCDGREWAYVSTLGVTASDGYCLDAEGWRHYYDDAGTPNDPSDDILIFSVHPNGNSFEGVASVSLAPTYYTVQATPATEGSWVTKRLWDFVTTSGSIDTDVRIRFYYEQEDKDEIIAAAQAFATANGLAYEPFEWFKSANGVTFNPAIHITPERVICEYGSWSGPYVTGAPTVMGTLAPQTFPYAEDADALDYSGPGNAYDVDNVWCNGVQYVEIGGLTGFSGGGGATGAGYVQSPLPVELVTFVGWNEGEVNQLEWVTASEINNDVFVVERSADGIDFVAIGSVEGHGTTSEEHTYNLTDFTPIIGVNYYRLKQVDFDGTFEYSPIIAVEVAKTEARNAIVKLHPNPTRDFINLQIQSSGQTDFDLEIWDIKGRRLQAQTYQAEAGLNAPISLDVAEYAQGVYIVKLVDRSSGETLEAKFVKQ